MISITTISGEKYTPNLPSKLLEIAREIQEKNGKAYLVGGWVRDTLLGLSCRDYDIEVYHIDEKELIEILSKYGKTNLVGKAFGVIHLAMRGLSLDFSFPRTESKIGYGHKGFLVHTNRELTFKEAALRRDFTINAMGMEIPDLQIQDPYQGKEDLKKSVLRHVSSAFKEDSLRVLRGVQFASRFHLTLAKETIDICKTLSLKDLSKERIFEEFKKWLLKNGKPSLGLKAFLDIELNKYFKEITPVFNSWENLGLILDQMTKLRKEILENTKITLSEKELSEFAFSALLSGNPNTAEAFLNRITNEGHLIKKVPLLLNTLYHLTPKDLKELPQIRRLALKLDGVKLLYLLLKCLPLNYLYIKEEQVENFYQIADKLNLIQKAPEPYLTGKMLIELGIQPGKQMGEIIKECFELQLNGIIEDKNQAFNWAKEKITSI